MSVGGSDNLPFEIQSTSSSSKWDGKDPNFFPHVYFGGIDYNFIETMKIEMIEGRTFSKSFSSDTSGAFLINEEMLKLMGTNSAIGKRFQFMGIDGTIIGLMKNFNHQTLVEKVGPLVFQFNPQPYYLVVRIQKGDIPSTIASMKSIWNKVNPRNPFEYAFFDEEFAKIYKSDEQMSTIFRYAASFAIIIAGIGLFGLASFIVEKRTKEIGIRKTLGASVSSISIMLSTEFVKWVLVANIIASPIAYFIMNKWLQDYANRISISWWILILTGVLTIGFALLTVSYRTIKAAIADPVKSLKCE